MRHKLHSAVSAAILLAVSTIAGLAGSASAQQAPSQKANPSAAELIEALRAKNGRGVAPAPSAAEMERVKLIDQLKQKASRGLSTGERQQLAAAVQDRPKVDIEIFFDFDSAKIRPDSEPALRSLGEALTSSSVAKSDFLVAGHTDAKGTKPYNVDLSQRRAAAVKQYLVETYKISQESLMAVGYGPEQMKNAKDPMAAENRRVQIVNMKTN